LAACVHPGRAATVDPTRSTYKDSIREISAAAGTTGVPTVTRSVLKASESAAPITFEVALRMRNFDELQGRIAQGDLVSPAEKEEKYFPLAGDHDRVVSWLKAQGLEVTRTDDNRMAIFGKGSVDAVAKAFQVSFARVTATDGKEFTSAVTAPSLPAELSSTVLGIHGLQPHIRRRPLSALQVLTPRINLSGYLPAQIATAYKADTLAVTGSNQTIAIYALGYPASSDLTAFWTAASSTQTISNVTQVNVGGGPESSPAEDIIQEASLDVEWAGALAPGAKIRVYGANDEDPADNDEILQQVYADIPSNPTMHVLSISVGGNESDVARDYLVIEAQYMANLASAGVTVLVASGDSGATEENQVQTTYPTSDPDVTGVGGTTLNLSAGNVITSETAWTSSGGGISKVFSRPAWQVGAGIPAGSMRLVPDVASVADPETGATYYYNGKAGIVGGTSWGAPTWAGWVALINQKTGTTLGLMNPKLYPLLGTSAFNDIISGNNGAYSAGEGYDLVTGLGTPNVAAIAAASLSASPAAGVPAQTGDQVVTTNQLATFYVVGSGTPLPTFQWQHMPNGSTAYSSLSDGGDYAGSQTQMLVVSGTSSTMTGDKFQCIVTNASGSTVSSAATLTVNQLGVTTLAGWPGAAGHVDATGRAARFSSPGGVRADSSGNVYVSDSTNYTIRKVTPGGAVTTVGGVPGTMGTTDGPVATALFGGVGGVAIDSNGNLFVADSGNYTIREISTSGNVTTIAGVAGTRGDTDGTGSGARLYDPQNLAIDSSNNIYVADGMGNVVRRVTEAGVVTTIAGSGSAGSADGAGTGASFNDPTGIAVDHSGNIYVADYGNNEVRMVTPAGVVTTIAGSTASGSSDGTGRVASFDGPAGVGVDSSGNIFVADSGNSTIRKIDPTGYVTTVGGSAGVTDNVDGLAALSRFNTPGDVTIDGTGIVYVADSLNSTIRRIVPGLNSAPFFTVQPVSDTVTAGASVTLAAGTAGEEPLSFQWNFNGSAISGATLPTYTITSVQQSNAGTYTLTITNAEGSATSSAATLTVNAASTPTNPAAQGRLVNISCRASVQTGSGITIAGFVIAGPAGSTKEVLIRGVGPTLGEFMITDYLAAPTITLLDSSGTVITSNSGWENLGQASAAAISAAESSLTFALTSTADTAMIQNLKPGSYTVEFSGIGATTGVGLVEVYELNSADVSTLSNISTRAQVGTGANIVIAGFVVHGTAPAKVLIRGVGPTLGISPYNVSGFLSQPILTVFDSTNTQIATNTGWENQTDPAAITAADSEVTFALPSGSADSALVMTLNPGTYTAQVTGANGTTGIALVEVYQLPQ
jgi:sugar lactone lactonase YvrE